MADPREPSYMRFRMFLPATSANLGPAFDAAALAFDFGLRIEAAPAAEFSIEARGHNAEQCGKMPSNLIVDTYTRLLEREGVTVTPLAIRLDNDIPLGMGCGSSAAAVLASVAMAAWFGGLEWDGDRIVSEASACEGHPDNVAACWHGGAVLARTPPAAQKDRVPGISVLPIPVAVEWPLLLAIPENPLATSEARRVLPRLYSRVDLIHNVQSAMLLVLAFSQGHGEWLSEALSDRVHHPYRAQLCPLLPALSGLSGAEGINGVALSGAGPSVLMFLEEDIDREKLGSRVSAHLAEQGMKAELRFTTISSVGAKDTYPLSTAAVR
ncbi:MAG TPA: homoserine kinase [Terriglobales bacterium]